MQQKRDGYFMSFVEKKNIYQCTKMLPKFSEKAQDSNAYHTVFHCCPIKSLKAIGTSANYLTLYRLTRNRQQRITTNSLLI